MKNKIFLAFGFLLYAFGSRAQTLVTTPMTGTPAAGTYYSPVKITGSPTLTFTATSTSSLNLVINNFATCLSLNTSPSQNQNYIMTSVPRIPAYNPAVTGYANCDVMQTIQYVDGLGRPLQTVQVKGSPAGNDIIQTNAYDAYGREATKYLPYSINSTAPGAYQPTALADAGGVYTNGQQYTFYQATGQGYVNTTAPSASVNFENSPLNRPVEQGAPGTAWQLSTSAISGSGHTVKMVYSTNDNVNYWANQYGVNIDASGNRTLIFQDRYQANQLSVTVSQDENWPDANDIHLNTTEEYKDKEGHVVLKRAYNYTSGLQVLSTYYVYDDFGNLAYVLPPASGGDGSGGITSAGNQTTLNNLCYQYGYDARNRMCSKQLPGKGAEYMVYNLIDQVIYKQDANEAAVVNNTVKWEYIKYDALGRVITTGMDPQATTSTYAALQSFVTNMLTDAVDTVKQWETPLPGGGVKGYTDAAFPWGPEAIPLTVNYYDDYTFTGKPTSFSNPTGVSTMTRGLLTGSQTTVLNTMYNTSTPPDRLWTVDYYDDLGRNIKTFAQHYLGGVLNTNNYDQVLTVYDFNNEPTSVTRKHYTSASTTTPLLTVFNSYVYDHMGRKLKTWEQLQNGTATIDTLRLLSQTDYNEIGQTLNKRLYSKDGSSFLQTVNYSYNERGWLLGSSAPLFQMQLQYNTGANKFYNGNIAYQLWGTATAPNTNNYSYTYDQLNRLTGGISADNYKETGITYDLMGNITALSRYQANTLIDQLTYTYTNAGNTTNQLQNIVDASSSNTGLVNGTTNYTYDSNGNLLSNTNTVNTGSNKSFTYNLLNLPLVATIPAGTVTYTYDATGNKLRKVSVLSGVTKKTDYINGIEYDNSTSAIGFIQTEEGKATPNGASYDYQYYLGDNLGNTRVTFGTKTSAAVLYQQDDYYPFGLEINRSVLSPKNEYLYNKKELQEELTQYDYGARFYDPIIARWNTIDPMAEKMRRYSPYNYVFDDPIRHTDPDGNCPGPPCYVPGQQCSACNLPGSQVKVTPDPDNAANLLKPFKKINVSLKVSAGLQARAVAGPAGKVDVNVGSVDLARLDTKFDGGKMTQATATGLNKTLDLKNRTSKVDPAGVTVNSSIGLDVLQYGVEASLKQQINSNMTSTNGESEIKTKVGGLTNTFDPDAKMAQKNPEPYFSLDFGIALIIGIDLHIDTSGK